MGLFVPAAPDPHAEEKLADPRLRRVIDYLHGSFGEEISLDGLALVAGLSPNYFLHAFKQTTGERPTRYLTELRIAKACELLQNPYRSIVEISLAVGFSSQSHLTTVFRRFMKTTPAAYREEVLGLRPPNHERASLNNLTGFAVGPFVAHAGGTGLRRLNLNYLLIFIPIAVALYWYEANPLLVFAMAALTIVPLSKIVGSSTETLGAYLGPTLGGLLNASMGNAPELIIGAFALKNGLITVVKASLTGSIIGNLLLTLGLAMFAGGLRYPQSEIQRPCRPGFRCR